MHRTTCFLLLLLLFSLSLRADDLNGRLCLLYPGNEPAVVDARGFLEKKLENLFRQLRYTDKLERKSLRRQVRGIEDRLQRDVLRHYDPAAELGDAFRNGTYNDATATLLYALTFEAFNLPHEGYVDHWESYLLVDPQDKRIAVRNPSARPHTPEAELTYRREYLALVRSTLDEELTALSPAEADAVFFSYYYRPGQRLTFRQLSAYEQYRRAQSAYATADYARADALLARAHQQESRPAFTLLERAGQIQLSALERPDVEGYVTELFALWREAPDNRYFPAALLQHFDERQGILLAQQRTEDARALLTRYLERSPAGQAAWAEKLTLLQSLRFLARYQERGETAQALHLAEALLTGAPDNPEFQNYVAELTLVTLRRTYPDPDTLVAEAEQAAERYPFLLRHERYADVFLRQAALRVRDRFSDREEAAALAALVTFREQLAAIPNGYDRTLWTLTAFVAASNYYFAEEDYPAARAYIEEALRHDPTNDFLLHQQDLLRRY